MTRKAQNIGQTLMAHKSVRKEPKMAEKILSDEFRKERMKGLKAILKEHQPLCNDVDDLTMRALAERRSSIFEYYEKVGDVLIQEVWTADKKENSTAKFFGVTAVDLENKLFVTMKDGKFQTINSAKTRAMNIFHKGDEYSLEEIVMEGKELEKEHRYEIDRIAWNQAVEKEDKRYEKLAEETKHLNMPVKNIDREFAEFCYNLPFNIGNRLFYKGGEGFCTRCKQPVTLKGKIKHLGVGECPSCKKYVTFVSRDRNHKTFKDIRCAMKLEEATDGYVLARYFNIEMSFDGDSIKPYFDIEEKVREFFKDNKLRVYKWSWMNMEKTWIFCKTTRNWDGNRTINLGYNFGKFSSYGGIFTKGLDELIAKTPFLQHCGFKKYLEYKLPEINGQSDEIRCLSDYLESHATNPYYEWIEKSGFTQLKDKIYSNKGLIFAIKNIKGKTLPEVFGVDRQTYRKIYEQRETIDDIEILMFREFPKLTDEERTEIRVFYDLQNLEKLKYMLQYTTYHKANKYLRSQVDEYNNRADVLRLWYDYIKMRDAYGEWDKKSEILLFPKYLKEAHDEIMELNESKEKAEARKLFKKKIQEKYRSLGLTDEEWKASPYSKILDPEQVDRIPVFFKLDKKLPRFHKKYDFRMDDCELFVTAPNLAYDIVKEGEKQNICVGRKGMGYIEKMAENQTVILFVRRCDAPNKPYFTVEVSGNSIVQVRGKANCAAKDDVKSLLTEYAKKKKLQYVA